MDTVIMIACAAAAILILLLLFGGVIKRLGSVILSIAVIIAVLVTIIYVYNGKSFDFRFTKSDTELIEDRINKFVSDYNSGDFDAVLESFSKKSRTAYRSTANIADSLVGKLTGLDVGASDLFGLMGYSADTVLTIENIDIELTSEDTAVVSAQLTFDFDYAKPEHQDAQFKMNKENGDWFITE